MVLWAASEFGDYTWQRQLSLAVQYGMDAIVGVLFALPAYLSDPRKGGYECLKDVEVEAHTETEDELDTFSRTFHTPAGRLSDRIALGRGRSRYGLAPSPVQLEPLVKDSEDVERLAHLLPPPEEVPALNLAEIEEAVGERGLVRVGAQPAYAPPFITRAMGMEGAMVGYYESRSCFDKLLHLHASYFQRVTKRMLEFGARYIYVSWHNLGISAGWSPAIWRENFMPLLHANVELVHSYDALYHLFDNGPIQPILTDIAETGVDTIASLCPPPLGDVELAEAKRVVGDRLCLIGNVDAINTMMRGDPNDVRSAVRETIEAAARGGGFILANSDTFFPGTPSKNIEAFFEAAREYGCDSMKG
jgi:hypothetical protein